jgi:uncharacterized phage-associated protein
MANVFDVAQYILHKSGRLTTWKLQKLCYYSQAWSLVWDEKPLFNEEIEAWANGPVIPDLYKRHKGRFYVTDQNIVGEPSKITKRQRDTIDAILDSYGKKSSSWLSELTHGELPWENARKRDNLSCGERGNAEIKLDEMAEYYGGLYAEQKK